MGAREVVHPIGSLDMPLVAFNRLLVADKQRQNAASRRMLPTGQRQRYPS